MDDFMISSIVEHHGLMPGDKMRSISGRELPDSVIMSNYRALVKGTIAGYYLLYNENIMTGEVTLTGIHEEELRVIKSFVEGI